MKVFLAGIIQGSKVAAAIHGQDWRGPIRRAVEAAMPEAEVYCHYSEHPDSITYDGEKVAETLEEGNRRAAESDLLVAYCPSASMGTAIEMYLAAKAGAAVVAVSPMAANWVLRVYSDRIVPDIEAFALLAASGELRRLLEEKNRT